MKRLHIFILGALNGAVYSAVMALLVRQVRARAYERGLAEAAVTGQQPPLFVANERWSSIIVIWIVIFAFTALLVNRVWARRKRSVLFWEAVGLIAIASWNVLVIVAVSIENWFAPTIAYQWITSSSNPLFGPVSLGVVLIVNFLYTLVVGVLVRASTAKT